MYCSIQDVRNRNSVILTSASVSDTIVEEYIDYAGSIVDGMLSGRHSVPFTSVPTIIKGLTADLAAAYCLEQIIGNRGENNEPTQAYDLRKNAVAMLQKIADGEIVLVSRQNKIPVRSSTYGQTPKFSSWNPSDLSSYG